MLPGRPLTPVALLAIARRYAWLIVVPPMFTTFAALMASNGVPNLYQSDMLIAVDPQRVPEGIVRSTVSLNSEQRLDSIAIQVLSRTTLQGLIETMNLYEAEQRLIPMADVVAQMRAKIELEPERGNQSGREGLDAFHVRFTHTDPGVAAKVTEQLGARFVDQNTRDRSARAESTNRFLETQLTEARRSLEEQEQRLKVFRERHGNALPTQMQNNLQAGASVQMQVQAMMESIARDSDRRQLLDRLLREAAAAPTATPLPPTAGASTAPPLQQQLAVARARLVELEERYTADHPDVVRARRVVAELEPKAAAEAQRGGPPTAPLLTESDLRRREKLSEMQAEIESLDRQIAFKTSEERRLRAEIAEYQRRVEAVPGLESEWVALTRDYETQQNAYKELLAKSGASKVAMNLEQEEIGELFRVVDPAGVPVHPLPSSRIRINLLGLALGLAIGLGLTAFLELRDTSFRSDVDVIDVLGLPVLALVPRIRTATELRVERRRRVWLSVTAAACAIGAGYVTWSLKLWNSIV